MMVKREEPRRFTYRLFTDGMTVTRLLNVYVPNWVALGGSDRNGNLILSTISGQVDRH